MRSDEPRRRFFVDLIRRPSPQKLIYSHFRDCVRKTSMSLVNCNAKINILRRNQDCSAVTIQCLSPMLNPILEMSTRKRHLGEFQN